MERGASKHLSRTYLAEHYQPGLTVEELERLVARVRASISKLGHEAKQVRYLRSTIIPRDESFLLIVEAASEELVREAYARAGVRFDRISKTLEDDATGVAAQAEPERRRQMTGRISQLIARWRARRIGRQVSSGGIEHDRDAQPRCPRGLRWAQKAHYTPPRRQARRSPVRVLDPEARPRGSYRLGGPVHLTVVHSRIAHNRPAQCSRCGAQPTALARPTSSIHPTQPTGGLTP